jgi:hypothetical protein
MYDKEETVLIYTLEKEHESLIPLIEEAFLSGRRGSAISMFSKKIENVPRKFSDIF